MSVSPVSREVAAHTWRELRAIVLWRDGYCCQLCKVQEATEVDHVVPRSLGGQDDLDNLQAACETCNRSKQDRVDFTSMNLSELRCAVAALAAKYQHARKRYFAAKDLEALVTYWSSGDPRGGVAEALRQERASA